MRKAVFISVAFAMAFAATAATARMASEAFVTNRVSIAATAATNYTDEVVANIDFSGYATTNDTATLSNSISNLTDTTATLSDEVQAVSNDFSLVYRLYSGSNVVCEVTNYNSIVHSPTMRLLQLDTNGVYITVWTETNNLHRIAQAATNYTDLAISNAETRADASYAPRAWSATTSGLGADAPDGVTWISTPETVIAGGYEYEKTVSSAGSVWVLCSNGMTSGTTTNSYFTIKASDGTELFSIEKTDSYLVGVDADGITNNAGTVTIPVGVVAAAHPYIRACTNLVNAAWEKEDDTGFSCDWATVAWSGSSGAYVATVTTSAPQAFFYFEFVQEGSTVIRNNAPTSLDGGVYYGGNLYEPTVSGTELKFILKQ